ncbi:unnamed protein product [Dracunculus medinensis]|uniref:SOCS box domain-containing protein n=1 Tax=Dracunculus medinensis TaxID=318479 RepID=A0A0N4U998_DRAME|nr:unnamed protein product [Dracunculus medinensis]
MKKCDVALCGDDHEYLLKFLLVGDSDVGKNEIADFLGASSSSNSAVTIPKTTIILLEGKRVRLQLWLDTSGQGRFSTVIKSYSRGAEGILLVYDITNRWSFDGIRRWLTEIEFHAPGIPKILIGNRLHLEFKRAVSRHEAEIFARKRNMQYYEVKFPFISTLAYFNVQECVTELARLVILRNGIRWLRQPNQVLSLQDLCSRVVIRSVINIHAIQRLPLPSFLKSEVRSFARGAEICMGSSPNHNIQNCVKKTKRSSILLLARSTSLINKHAKNATCALM